MTHVFLVFYGLSEKQTPGRDLDISVEGKKVGNEIGVHGKGKMVLLSDSYV
jgi:hypothetical protein